VPPLLDKVIEVALDFLFPKRCVGCGKEGKFICDKCLREVRRIFPPVCPLCGRPYTGGVLCPSCVTWQASVDGIRSPFRFEGIIREAIHQLKYNNIRKLSNLMASFLNDYLERYPMKGDVIVPVPLHPKRLRERGYNQSALLAEELGKIRGLPVIEGCLVRQKYIKPQAKTLSVLERRKNVEGVFICVDNRLKGKDVLIIDDVSTSGATIDACARAVKSSGAISVRGLVLAREI